jgi:hypothetical protein
MGKQVRTLAKEYSTTKDESIYMIGFDWRAKAWMTGHLGGQHFRDFAAALQRDRCWRAVLHVKGLEKTRVKVHLLEIGGGEVYGLNVNTESMSVRWCSPDTEVAVQLRLLNRWT